MVALSITQQFGWVFGSSTYGATSKACCDSQLHSSLVQINLGCFPPKLRFKTHSYDNLLQIIWLIRLNITHLWYFGLQKMQVTVLAILEATLLQICAFLYGQ